MKTKLQPKKYVPITYMSLASNTWEITPSYTLVTSYRSRRPFRNLLQGGRSSLGIQPWTPLRDKLEPSNALVKSIGMWYCLGHAYE